MDMDQAFEGLKQIAKRCWETSESKGWHKEKVAYAELKKAAEILPTLQQTFQPALDAMGGERTQGVPVMSKLMLICTEVAEAAEVFRDAKKFPSLRECYVVYPATPWPVVYDDNLIKGVDGEAIPPRKPEGFGSELADIVIRVFDLAEDMGIDLATEIKRKMRYNESRPYRHGGKVA